MTTHNNRLRNEYDVWITHAVRTCGCWTTLDMGFGIRQYHNHIRSATRRIERYLWTCLGVISVSNPRDSRLENLYRLSSDCHRAWVVVRWVHNCFSVPIWNVWWEIKDYGTLGWRWNSTVRSGSVQFSSLSTAQEVRYELHAHCCGGQYSQQPASWCHHTICHQCFDSHRIAANLMRRYQLGFGDPA